MTSFLERVYKTIQTGREKGYKPAYIEMTKIDQIALAIELDWDFGRDGILAKLNDFDGIPVRDADETVIVFRAGVEMKEVLVR